ncbi:enoyl-CoA hydratase/carnithine racemase [Sinobacterium caligoides]|uniref:Enoyl-CoA hydratase/carnithine racemase n=1 Tax=Sinobacterium caligoides TaxID=933926 RepID=A0A3N2E1K1_9GAMM|nr:enoyl-CoA hydratase-related protein [Sinobacterium caligoides]ROS05812.1 enoyl-CoA hydratase/carnithine racemase [Sinobacterium caligoides]
MDECLLKELNDGVLTLTFNRPEKKNALNIAGWLALEQALLVANEDPMVAVVVLTGQGGNFSAGADLADFSVETAAEHPFDKTALALALFNKPLLCAIDGVAVGGGATLALHADIIYVGGALRMNFPFTRIGLSPELGSSYLLPQMIGARQASEILLTSEWIDADRCVELGIATAQFTSEQLLEQTMRKALEMAQWPVSSLVATKKLLKDVTREPMLAALEREGRKFRQMLGQPENIEAVTAMLESRAPDFRQFRQANKV